jgi:hypothetical protein
MNNKFIYRYNFYLTMIDLERRMRLRPTIVCDSPEFDIDKCSILRYDYSQDKCVKEHPCPSGQFLCVL